MTQDGGNTTPRIDRAEHVGPLDTGDNIEAKRVVGYVWDAASGLWVRSSGNPAKINSYSVARIDPTTIEPYYYGFEDKDGNWYIMQETESTGVWLYCTGTGGILSVWASRAGLTYGEKGAIF